MGLMIISPYIRKIADCSNYIHKVSLGSSLTFLGITFLVILVLFVFCTMILSSKISREEENSTSKKQN